jgi:hypothetical protein
MLLGFEIGQRWPEAVMHIDLQIINCTRLEGKIRVRRTLGYVVEDFDR